MNGKNMDSMIRNLYAKIVLGGISGDAAIREREAEVDKELKSTEIELGQQEYEKFRDCALSVACMSEELGFCLVCGLYVRRAWIHPRNAVCNKQYTQNMPGNFHHCISTRMPSAYGWCPCQRQPCFPPDSRLPPPVLSIPQ